MVFQPCLMLSGKPPCQARTGMSPGGKLRPICAATGLYSDTALSVNPPHTRGFSGPGQTAPSLSSLAGTPCFFLAQIPHPATGQMAQRPAESSPCHATQGETAGRGGVGCNDGSTPYFALPFLPGHGSEIDGNGQVAAVRRGLPRVRECGPDGYR